MPAIYAHFRFGEEAIPRFTEAQQKLIQSHRASFDMGLLGPDIFFYAPQAIKDFIKGKPNFGSELHSYSFDELVIRMMLDNRPTNYDPSVLAYYFGYLGHFLLDAHAHPTVNRLTEDSSSHFKLERRFDEALADIQGKKMWEIKIHKRIEPDLGSMFKHAYRNFPEIDAKSAGRWLHRLRRVLFATNATWAATLRAILNLLDPALAEIMYVPNIPDTFDEPDLAELRENFEEGLRLFPECLTSLETILHHGPQKPPQIFALNFAGEIPGTSATTKPIERAV